MCTYIAILFYVYTLHNCFSDCLLTFQLVGFQRIGFEGLEASWRVYEFRSHVSSRRSISLRLAGVQLCFNEPHIWTLLIYISYLYTASKISTFVIVNASDKKVCNSCKEKEKRMFYLPQSAARSATLLLLDLGTERPQCRMNLSPPR